MIKNFLTIAWRHLKKNKGYSLLNIVGLALGMACALLILLWVNDEVQYNTFHKNYNQLYQVLENQKYDGKTFTFGSMPGPFGPALKQEIPEVEYVTRTDWGSRVLFSYNDKSLYEQGLHADPDFLKMFSFEWLKGDPNNQLTDPSSVILTDVMAKKYFGNEDPMGKTIKANNEIPLKVTGIIKDPPVNSTIRFHWLASFKAYEKRNDWLLNWGNNGIQTYAQLKANTDPVQVNKKIHDFITKKDTSTIAKPFLFSIKDWRLRYDFEEGKQTGKGRIEFVKLFSLIALFIIIIACINFMNLATARSEQRAKEVGVRKVMGASRGVLIRQFFGESLVMSITAMILAGIIVFLVLPAFNTLVEKKLVFDLTNPVVWGGLPAIAVFCGVIAGSYPSLYLSSFNPSTVFRGLRANKDSVISYIRKGLVVAQFVVSIVLIICTIIVYRQIDHVKGRQLGFSRDKVLYSYIEENVKTHFDAIRNDLLASGAVENAALSNNSVLEIGSSSSDFRWAGKDPTKEVLITMDWVTPQYVPTMHMQLAYGRNFYDEGTKDSNSVIINETLAGIIGKKNPTGEYITRDNRQLLIAGVVKDFVYNNMYKRPDPLLIFCQPDNAGVLLVRLKDKQDVTTAMKKVEAVMKSNNSGYPFEYTFMDDDFNNLFKSEMLVGKLSRVFAGLTILISCMGLFGLAAYTAERRTKEIGIRKVLGASLPNVIALLSKDFLLLVALASVLAFPLAWWLMHVWLQGYSYRITIEWWIFIAAGLMAVIVALLTVSFQAIKAGLMNPVKSLRSE
jgi:putative ABC transport system permease protein